MAIPKTIEELKAFCAEKGMPLEKMRFFIGEDYREARAFGIYKDEDGRFVVYKNKSDGSRAVRYHGYDEAYAVKEIYEKLRSEVEIRRGNAVKKKPKSRFRRIFKDWLLPPMVALLIFALPIAIGLWSHRNAPRGYYQYQSQTYYYDYNNWYVYDDLLSSWARNVGRADWMAEPKDYFLSSQFNDAYSVDDFKTSEYYQESKSSNSKYSSDDDSSWSYDYDSWDSGYTNWDSDW